jgi:hypothetical protein
MTKKRDQVTFTGPMVVNMKVVGKMVNSMDSVLTLLLVAKPNRVNGLTVKDFNGSTIMKQISDF